MPHRVPFFGLRSPPRGRARALNPRREPVRGRGNAAGGSARVLVIDEIPAVSRNFADGEEIATKRLAQCTRDGGARRPRQEPAERDHVVGRERADGRPDHGTALSHQPSGTSHQPSALAIGPQASAVSRRRAPTWLTSALVT